MRKFPCLLFVLKRSYVCYYIICMTYLQGNRNKKIKRQFKIPVQHLFYELSLVRLTCIPKPSVVKPIIFRKASLHLLTFTQIVFCFMAHEVLSTLNTHLFRVRSCGWFLKTVTKISPFYFRLRGKLFSEFV